MGTAPVVGIRSALRVQVVALADTHLAHPSSIGWTRCEVSVHDIALAERQRGAAVTKKWRLGRAAIYGAITGFILTLIGLPFAPPDPQEADPVAHTYFLIGQWTGLTVFCAVLFIGIAAARNLFVRKPTN